MSGGRQSEGGWTAAQLLALLVAIGVLGYAVYDFVAGRVTAGCIAVAFGVLVAWAPRARRDNRPAVRSLIRYAWKAGAIAAGAFALAFLELTGTWMRRDSFRGILAAGAGVAFVYLAVRICLDSMRARGTLDEHRLNGSGEGSGSADDDP